LTGRSLLTEIPWETRNLGVPSYSLSVSAVAESGAPALAEALAEAAEGHGPIFVQAKIDREQGSLAQLIGSVGFYFIEVALTPHLSLRRNVLLEAFERDPAPFLRGRFSPGELHFGPVDQKDTSAHRAIRQIAGSSFNDDRFHLDPNCDPDVASNRYRLWVDQMLADEDHRFFVLSREGQVMAFMVQRDTRLPLAGFAPPFARSGLGEFFWLSTLLEMRKQNLSRVTTGISTNNTAVLNLYTRMGFRFREPTAVFHYWSRPGVQVSKRPR